MSVLSIEKASSPELVDVKVTDYCNYGCDFCYQGSNERGKHADIDSLIDLKDALNALRVWEVAIGGGEPTQWKGPHIEKLEDVMPFLMSWNNVTANLTTRNPDVIEYLDGLYVDQNKHLDGFGAVAFSVESVGIAEKIHARYQETELSKSYSLRNKIVYQYIVGVGPDKDLVDLLKWAKKTCSRLTLLGFKTTGRGKSYATKGLKSKIDWLPFALESAPPGLGIDTALATEYKKELEESNIPKTLITYKEGAFSCYIDAVNWKMGPSSYCGKSRMVPLPVKKDKLSEDYVSEINKKYVAELSSFIQKTFASWKV